MINKLPKTIIINNEKYYLEYYQVNDDNILKGWWQAIYRKDENSMPPEVLIDNKFYEYLASTGITEEEMIEDMKRKLKGANLI